MFGRLLSSAAINAKNARLLAKLALEEGEPLPSAPSSTPGGDAERLRGIPVVGYGVSGAIVGSDYDSRPLPAAIREEARRER